MRNKAKVLLIAVGALLLITGAVVFTGASTTTTDGRGDSVWGANYFPNVPLIAHDGRTVHFFDDLIKGKVVAINFIYTSCPDACPMETARLLEVQRLLGDRMGKDVFFYSITIDPDYDTQPVLAKFAEDWGIGSGWTFLTGKEADITLLRKKLGLYIEEIQGDDSRDHNLSLIIGNQKTGRWMKRSPFENSHVLAKQIGGELHNWKIASVVERDYASAPELRNISNGETLFRTRCASCHTIGDGDIVDVAARRIGPDLYNVPQQRDRQWLERWLAEPDEMLKEEDPLAMALLAQYRNVPMPNLRLTEMDVQHLIEYMEVESLRVSRLGQSDTQMAHHGNRHENHHGAHHGESAKEDQGDPHGDHQGDHQGSHGEDP